MKRLISLFITALIPVLAFCLKEPIANTQLGLVLGTIQKSRRGDSYYSFRGLRYAESPAGDQRFKPPVPAKPWNGVYDATMDGPACYQPFLGHFFPFSEDCLHLNVYTKRINTNKDSRPVLVYIHGGSYATQTGRSDWIGPDYLMDHDIVFVSINYRLNTLGFFSTGDSYAPGNYGAKDQVEALKWIQRNIRAFGGDPSRVTLCGESAGSAAAGLHLASPMSRGLFHGAILLAGSLGNTWAINRQPLKLAKKIATSLKCPVDTSQNMVECMRKVPAEDTALIYSQLLEWLDEPQVFLSPVVESDNGIERFITKDPLISLKEGDLANVPIFLGVTQDEFAYKALPKLRNKEWTAEMNTNWTKIAPIAFMYEPNDTISNRLREFYLGSIDKPITNDSYDGLGKLYSDAGIIHGVFRAAKFIAEKSKKPVYLFQFNYEGKYQNSDFKGEPIPNLPPGIFHGDELNFMVYRKAFKRQIKTFLPGTDDGAIVDKWTTLVKNFIETGNPTPEKMEVLDNVIWPPVKNGKNYLDINKTLTARCDMFFEDRMSFFDKLFPL